MSCCLKCKTYEEQKFYKDIRNQRLRETKELEKDYSAQIVSLYRAYQEELKRQQDFKEAIETYQRLVKEIDDLKLERVNIIERKRLSKIEQQKQDKLREEYLLKVKQKKAEFEKFMKEKGKEALEYLAKVKKMKEELDEELHRYKQKKNVKISENLRSEKVVEKFRENEEKLRQEEIELTPAPQNFMNLMYTLTTPYQGKIDYSKTQFHNVTLVKHAEEIVDKIKEDAFEKAKKEEKHSEKVLKEKRDKLEEFKKNQKENFREQIRKEKAKENLARLNEEVSKLNQMRKKNKSKPKKTVDYNSNLTKAKGNDKKSENLLNKLLTEQKENRRKIYGSKENQIILEDSSSKNKTANDEEMRDFYKEESECNDDYYQRAMEEHNKMIEKNNSKYNYEEPISRDKVTAAETISRLNPVDLSSFQKVEVQTEFDLVHKKSALKPPQFKIETEKPPIGLARFDFEPCSKKDDKFNVLEALDLKNRKNRGKGKESLDSKNLPKFEDFQNLDPVQSFLEEIRNIEPRNNIFEDGNTKTEFMSIIGSKDKSVNEVNASLSETLPKLTDGKSYGSIVNTTQKGVLSTYQGSTIPAGSIEKRMENSTVFIDNAKGTIKIEEKKEDPKEEIKEEKDKKWKYNKKELYERKKQMLKDKSNFQKK